MQVEKKTDKSWFRWGQLLQFPGSLINPVRSPPLSAFSLQSGCLMCMWVTVMSRVLVCLGVVRQGNSDLASPCVRFRLISACLPFSNDGQMLVLQSSDLGCVCYSPSQNNLRRVWLRCVWSGNSYSIMRNGHSTDDGGLWVHVSFPTEVIAAILTSTWRVI